MSNAKEIADKITKAMEGVSHGKWCQFHPSYAPEAEGTPFSDWDSSHDMSAVKDRERTKRLATFKHADDAAYVDATQPDNMRVILSALVDAERERDQLRAKLAEAVKVIEPFGKAAGMDMVFADKETIEDTIAADHITLGRLRAAAAFLASIKGGEDAKA
ncbi:hypothetical protein [Rhizobium sp. RCAM05973]|uniref:hypothetical protein n=1 Tax=Rhizobium sp. RCAM05973 TaxID=2994066 RepID=UPI0022EBA6DF|nr:hypothetical protein [Rhizobium sp. RCAM05973]